MKAKESVGKTLEECYIEVSETSEVSDGSRRKTENEESDTSLCEKVKGTVVGKQDDEDYNPNLIFKKDNSNKEKSLNGNNFNSGLISKRQTSKTKNNKPVNPTKYNSNTNQISNQISNLNQITHSNSHSNSNGNQLLATLNKQLDESKSQVIKLRGEKIMIEEENAILKLEKEKLLTIKDSQISTLNEKVMKMEIENNKLNEIVAYTKRRLDEYNPKVFKYDELFEKYSRLLTENDRNSDKESTLTSLLQSLKKEKEETNSKCEILRIENESLRNDKFYLSKESMTANEKQQSSLDKIKSLEEEMREMRKVNQSYLDKLTEKNLNIEGSFVERLRKETEGMKKSYEVDRANLKRLFEELAEKRCCYLTEEKEEYKFKVVKLEKTLKDKEEAVDFLNNELRAFTKRSDEETAFLRIQLKVKTEEKERLANLYEENCSLIKVVKSENESHKDKNDLIRSELIRKEADFRSEGAELKSQICMLKEKLHGYEVVEDELDKVIVDSAVVMNEEHEVMSIIKDIPTSAKRRISQCLVLANKVKIATVEVERLKDLNKRLEDNLRNAAEERDLFKSVSDKVKQPQSYLLKNLQDLEVEVYRKDKHLQEKDATVKSLLRENEILGEKVKAMESDMKVLLNNRRKLDNLEDVIAQFMRDDLKQRESGENFSGLLSTKNQTGFNSGLPLNASGLNDAPERDYSTNHKSTNYNRLNNLGNSNMASTLTTNDKIPKWYMNLKAKKI